MDYSSPTEIMRRVGIYLSKAMPTNKEKLADHLVGLEACRYELAEKTVEWHQTVAEVKNRMLHPKDKDLTELDRNVMLESHVAVIRKDYELLVKLDELIRDRIELGKLLLQL